MKTVLVIVIALLTFGSDTAWAQRDQMKMQEFFGVEVKKGPAAPPTPAPAAAPAPSTAAPIPPPAEVQSVVVTPAPVVNPSAIRNDDTVAIDTEPGAVTGELLSRVLRSAAHIRDTYIFMVGWGQWGQAPEFQDIAAKDLKISVAGQFVPLKQTRLVSAKGYVTMRDAQGKVVGMRVDKVLVRLARGFTAGRAQLDLAPRAGGGYTVTGVTITN